DRHDHEREVDRQLEGAELGEALLERRREEEARDELAAGLDHPQLLQDVGPVPVEPLPRRLLVPGPGGPVLLRHGLSLRGSPAAPRACTSAAGAQAPTGSEEALRSLAGHIAAVRATNPDGNPRRIEMGIIDEAAET